MIVENGTHDIEIESAHGRLLDAVNTIITCLAVLGNGMVITVMLLRRRVFSSFTNRLILHQSIIDCVAGVVFFSHQVLLKNILTPVSMKDTIIGQLLCRLIHTHVSLWCINVTSTYNLVVISLERFMATCYPVKHRNSWSVAKLKFAIGTAWAIGFIYGSHYIFMYEAGQDGCQRTTLETGLKIFENVVVAFIEYLVPITILIYTYSRIIIKLTKKSANPMYGPRNAMNKAKKSVLVTTVLIGLMFVVCWTPKVVFRTCSFIMGKNDGWFYAITNILVACNTFVNPIIYCFKYEHFRSELRSLVIRRCRRNRVEDRNAIPMPAAAPRMNPNLAVQSL
ncbi:cysteinyl leukotriene receptor 2-like [Patiria miniata]|uniref:G-protein coupled receptors family 1 profile domain-containing protein n=1 Tax=Patiria miniata TaxID=46514 RepID=A0A914AZI6_PATMI|nr:cysteinyl leukotriene receptor 2-like [Patiria miniata]